MKIAEKMGVSGQGFVTFLNFFFFHYFTYRKGYGPLNITQLVYNHTKNDIYLNT